MILTRQAKLLLTKKCTIFYEKKWGIRLQLDLIEMPDGTFARVLPRERAESVVKEYYSSSGLSAWRTRDFAQSFRETIENMISPER